MKMPLNRIEVYRSEALYRILPQSISFYATSPTKEGAP